MRHPDPEESCLCRTHRDPEGPAGSKVFREPCSPFPIGILLNETESALWDGRFSVGTDREPRRVTAKEGERT